ncbi:efflux RND transporter periplasmic adaptor subunit [Propionicimonas sp.]|uniref:efflux RND transporter periplasmic adaptor subunit n=1 Tax=Propionicimonas sp. TaxID=1955623 RepID=UPI0039E4FDF9
MADTPRRRPPRPVIAILLLLLVGGGIWWWWSSSHTAQTAEAASTLTGSVEADTYQVAPAISGRVGRVLVAEGDAVKKGQTLVTLDDAALRLQVEQAKAGVTAAKAALTNVRNDDDSTDADVTAAKAKVTQAEAAVELARTQRAYTTITAPHAGTVTSVTVNVGENASAARTLLTLTDPGSLFARVYVAETEIGNVKVGRAATATTDSSAATFAGTVTYVATSAQFTPNTIQTKDQRVKLVYEVRVRLSDDSGTLKPGMPVDVALS